MKLKKEIGPNWVSWSKTEGRSDATVIKNPSFKEYFKIKEVDGYVRGFYDYMNDNMWIWRGEMLHRFASTHLDLPQVCKFVLETNIFVITSIEDRFRSRVINKLKEFEPLAKEEKRWIGD